MTAPTARRTVLTAALAAATAAAAAAPATAASGKAAAEPGNGAEEAADPETARQEAGAAPAPCYVDNHFRYSYGHWRAGTHRGTVTVGGRRPGLAVGAAEGRTEYLDPHTGRKASWEYASWLSPVHRSTVPATEVIASWNAQTPPGTWLQVELQGSYADGTRTPWYVMARWASGDGDVRRTSVDGQKDGRTTVWTDTLSVDDPAAGHRLVAHQLRLTLYRTPRTRKTPVVWLAGAMASAVPDRFTVPASTPRLARELVVPRYSQEIHKGRYPQYDNGGEAWCSPTSSQMIIEYWGRRPDDDDLAWVDPGYTDPQVCHAARSTYDHQYKGCGNWPFNAAYAATYEEMAAVVTRLSSLTDLETLVRAGIPAITSQSFLKGELTGAGYGTAGHLMTVIGFTAAGDVVANDPNSPTDPAVRRVYKRHEFETVWLRTKRKNAEGKVVSGPGGVCYLYAPARPTPAQLEALRTVGVI
ncbi:peptidase C39 family protein [Streptomyces sp. NPDC089919]|uniref:peptidase C39 family protein n=1 Tax=Streptomyces sp. NPDC089919 TaxID=3155188 RepID=UPI003441D60F